MTYRVEKLTAEGLAELGTFDVVLALSVLHHCPDWRAMLERLPGMARSRLVLETPNPAERLRQAVARDELAAIDAAVRPLGESIGASPAVHQRGIMRRLVLHRAAPLKLNATVESGNGNHSQFAPRFAKKLRGVLGYRPYAGSLNLRMVDGLDVLPRLGIPAAEYIDRRKVGDEERDCDYQYWPARLVTRHGGVYGHAMQPGGRGHGPATIEFVAAKRLRDAYRLTDGDVVELKVGA